MVKHLSVRFAWHDSKWNGKICRDPEQNVYCTGNYSLLSPRLQRRIDLGIENDFKNTEISKTIDEQGYFPPCYWCINAQGDEECLIEDLHPFAETSRGRRFGDEVPPLKVNLVKNSVFS